MKRGLDLGTDNGLCYLDRQQQRLHGAVFHPLDAATPGGHTAAGIRGILVFFQALSHAGVAHIAVYPLVILTDHGAGHGDIGDVSLGGGDTMGQSGDCIDTDMGLHAEIQLAALHGLLHLRIALLGLVLSGGGGRHDDEVRRRQCIDQTLPWHQGLHLVQESLSSGNLFLVLVLCLGEQGVLLRMVLSSSGEIVRFHPPSVDQAAAVVFVQRFPRWTFLPSIAYILWPPVVVIDHFRFRHEPGDIVFRAADGIPGRGWPWLAVAGRGWPWLNARTGIGK